MFRLSGCILIVVASSLYGITYAGKLKRHTRELTCVISMLGEISELIRYTKCTTEEILSRLAADISYNGLLNSIGRELYPDESKLLDDTLSKLGTTDSEGQLAMIGYSVSRFRSMKEAAEAAQKEKCRLYEVLGFMSGAFLAVLLI